MIQSATAHLHRHSAHYQSALPFPHAVFDHLLPRGLVEAVAAEHPENSTDANGCVIGKTKKCFMSTKNFRRAEVDSKTFGPRTRELFDMLRSPDWVRALEKLTGIPNLIPDLHGFAGSGVHMTGDGGFLGLHADYNYKNGLAGPTMGNDDVIVPGTAMVRRVNTLFYLNDEWPDDFGGHLEFWDRGMRGCQRRISPTPLGRYVVFTSNDFSYHGHPAPMRLPPTRMRRSASIYYYTRESFPAADCQNLYANGTCAPHTTLYQKPRHNSILQCPVSQ